MNEWINGWVNELMETWMIRWMMHGWMCGWTDNLKVLWPHAPGISVSLEVGPWTDMVVAVGHGCGWLLELLEVRRGEEAACLIHKRSEFSAPKWHIWNFCQLRCLQKSVRKMVKLGHWSSDSCGMCVCRYQGLSRVGGSSCPLQRHPRAIS